MDKMEIPAKGLAKMKGYSDIVPTFLKSRGLYKHHIESFDYFVEHGMQTIVNANAKVISDVRPESYVWFKKVWIGSPQIVEGNAEVRKLYPHVCRLRDLTYSAPIFFDLEYTQGNSTEVYQRVELGTIPVMVRSGTCVLSKCTTLSDFAKYQECPLDPGGYFIAKGQERVILIQEQLVKNRIILERDNDKHTISCQVFSSSSERKSRISVLYKNDVFYLQHNSLTDDIPMSILLRAMGVSTDEEMVNLVGWSIKAGDTMFLTILAAIKANVVTERQALEYIGKRIRARKIGEPSKRPDEVCDLLMMSILPHIPAENFNFRTRTLFLGIMIRRIIDALDDENVADDKDYYGNKRMELTGQFMGLLFEDLFKKLCSDLKKKMDVFFTKNNRQRLPSILPYLNAAWASKFEMAISTGRWEISRFKMSRQGVTQVLSRQSFISALGMMTRVQSQVEKTRKTAGPRSLHLSQYGMIGLCDTPEGESCGLVKNLALMSHITTEAGTEELHKMLFGIVGLGYIEYYDHRQDSTFVFLNGILIGFVKDVDRFVKRFKDIRRACYIHPFASIFTNVNHKSIYISSDSGRLVRPYLILYEGKTKLTEEHLDLMKNLENFDYLLSKGIVEYLDVNEENDADIAVYDDEIKPHHTHLEIEPYTLLGVCAATIPYANHNQSPRNTYQCAMGKQAMGAIGYNQFQRIDTIQYNLVYGQKPLVTTEPLRTIGFDELPAGHNAIICVMSFSGFDIEDAIVLNRSSLDRGFGRCVVYKSAKTTLQRHARIGKDGEAVTDRVAGPLQEVNRHGNLETVFKDRALEADGLAARGVPVQTFQTLLQKTVPELSVRDPRITTPEDKDLQYRPEPLSSKETGTFYVDKVMIASHKDNNNIVKFSLRQTRRPEVGDKFSSRHGQKGVTGLIVPHEDLPFNERGIIPDLIMNPHGFPSRMTVGKLLELIGGKAGAIQGQRKYGTIFKSHKVENIMEILHDYNYSYTGKEIFYSGASGAPLESYVFTGPVYYQKLKHMVADKINVRRTGRTQFLTRQPTEGKARGGGLRVGEMERDCLIGHGVSELLVERLNLSSDAFSVCFCKNCGKLADERLCVPCNRSDCLKPMKIPYAFKLLIQELMSMGISTRMGFQNITEKRV